ncbi:MAG TPA: feruloyl-CoA synthase, partial [Burkholderiales bacterium]
GHDRDEICALLFPNLQACRGMPPATLRAHLQRALDLLAGESTGSSTRIARALLLEVPPSIDAGEITDKGSINQRAVLRTRADLVERLYAEPPSPDVIVAAA